MRLSKIELANIAWQVNAVNEAIDTPLASVDTQVIEVNEEPSSQSGESIVVVAPLRNVTP